MILDATEIGAGAGVPAVLLHGLFGDRRNLGTLHRALGRSRRTLALDLRNHGNSPRAPGMAYAAMAEDIAETLDARQVGRADLVGHSMGGKAAMAVALRHPGRVRRLVVADIAPKAYPPRNGRLAAAMQGLDLSCPLSRAAADAALAEAVTEPDLRQFLLRNLQPGDAPGWRLGLAEIADAMAEIEGWDLGGAPAFDGPTLFLLGGDSPYVTDADHGAIRALFPRASLRVIEGAGHWLHVDQPAAFIGAVQGFLG